MGHGDYIAVQLKPAAVAFFEAKRLEFLKVASLPKVDDQIVVFDYGNPEDQENPEVSFGQGAIQDIRGYTLEYHVPADAGTSGSPLVMWTGEAIGIHHSREAEHTPADTKKYTNARDPDATRPVWRQ